MTAAWLDWYRYAVTLLALFMIGINLFLTFIMWASGNIGDYRPAVARTVWCAYTITAAATGCVSAYFRLRDGANHAPFGTGDLTALIPTVGFTAAGILGLRLLGRRSAPTLDQIVTDLPHNKRRDDPV